MTTTDLAPGGIVTLARPENPRHPFKGRSGTIVHVSEPGRPGRIKVPNPDKPGHTKEIPGLLPDTMAFVFFECEVPPPRPLFARGMTIPLWASEMELL